MKKGCFFLAIVGIVVYFKGMDELAKLQQENTRLKAEKQALEAKIEADKASTTQQIDSLKHRVALLERLYYGAKRERFVPAADSQQLPLPFEGQAPKQDTPPAAKEQVSYERRKPKNQGHPGRNSFPKNLPRVTERIEPECDTQGLPHIGDEVTEVLEYTPAKLHVHRIERPKYSLGKEQGVTVAPMPERPLPKCIAGPGLLAHVVTAKFVDHLPIYRQTEIFKREGIKIATATIDGWQEGIYQLLLPLYEAMKAQIIAEGYLQVDETPVKVTPKGKPKTVTGYHWAYHAPVRKAVLFDYQPNRSREGPWAMLKGFQGYLQTDGYQAYDAFGQLPGITLVSCLAHIRRYFERAVDSDSQKATYALQEIQKLYAVERKAREHGLAYEQRHALRLEEALPIANQIGQWMANTYNENMVKSPIKTALVYGINHWDTLLNYLKDGALEIDNNLVENKIRPIAIGRKNFLFHGSHHGGDRAALFYSFMATCKQNHINPYNWLKYTLEKLPSYKINNIHELLPYNIDPNLLE